MPPPRSPWSADLYMRRFVLGSKMLGLERTLRTRPVTYADDVVILCRRSKGRSRPADSLREIMGKLKLTAFGCRLNVFNTFLILTRRNRLTSS